MSPRSVLSLQTTVGRCMLPVQKKHKQTKKQQQQQQQNQQQEINKKMKHKQIETCNLDLKPCDKLLQIVAFFSVETFWVCSKCVLNSVI